MAARNDMQAPRSPSGPGRLWAQIKLIGGIVVAILFVLGAFQLWDLQLRSHRFVVEVAAEVDVRGFDNSAEWLFQQLEFQLVDPSSDEVILQLAPGPGLVRRETVDVRGRHQHRLAQSNRLVGYFHHPALPPEAFRFTAAAAPVRGDTLSSVLTLNRTQAFLRRRIQTLISVRDDRDRLVTGLQTYRGIPLVERAHEPGIYDIEISVDDFIYQLEEHDKFTIDVAIEQEPEFRKQVEVPAAWFTGQGRERHVVTLGGLLAASPVVAVDSATGPRQPAAEARMRVTVAPPSRRPASTPDRQPEVGAAEPGDAVGGTPEEVRVAAGVGAVAGTVTPAAEPEPAPAQEQPVPSSVPVRGELRIRVLPYADFYVGDRRVASQVGLAETEVEPGTYTVRVEHPYFKPHTWNEVAVEAGATVSLFHSFPTNATGRVTVGWRQGWAEVHVDGKATTKTTPCELTLAVGPHVLTLVRDGAPLPGMRREIQVIEEGEVHVQF